MTECAYPTCENEEIMPFICKYCNKPFCKIHRLPENHNCENLHLLKSPVSTTKKSKDFPQEAISTSQEEKGRKKRLKREAKYDDYYEPDFHFYTKDEKNNVYRTQPSERKALERSFIAKIGDYFTTGKEWLDFIIGLLVITIPWALMSRLISRIDWQYIGFVAIIIAFAYILLIIPQKFLVKKFGYKATYVLTKLNLIVSIITIILPFRFLSPGFLLIPEIDFMNKKEQGLVSSIGLIINILVGIVYFFLGWFLIAPKYPQVNLLLINGTFFISQIVLWNLIPYAFFQGKRILKWSKLIYSLLVLSSLGLLVGSLLLKAISFF